MTTISLQRVIDRPYQQCVRCVMDTTDPWIEFDAEGVCNHCKSYAADALKLSRNTPDGHRELEQLIEAMKVQGQGKAYDCVIGVSGGVDSTYVAYLVRKFGLRPLAVHLDNGWDAELAVSNIEKVLKHLNIDLMTYVLDWDEFRDIQLAFLKASVPDGEIPSDHAIGAVVYQAALKHGIQYVISGSNIVTEGILPLSWTYGIQDWRYISSIHRLHGTVSLKTYPHTSLWRRAYTNFARQIKSISILNYVSYTKAYVLRLLESELGWQYYGGKHYESLYTRFFQGYILPRKFKIDKRLAHYSTLICSGQMSREAAIESLKDDPYPPALQREDRSYVIKKLGLTEAEFEALMALPVKTFLDYPNDYALTEHLRSVLRFARRFGLGRGRTSL